MFCFVLLLSFSFLAFFSPQPGMSGDSFVMALKQSFETENTVGFLLQMSNNRLVFSPLCLSPLEISSDLGTAEAARIQKSA